MPHAVEQVEVVHYVSLEGNSRGGQSGKEFMRLGRKKSIRTTKRKKNKLRGGHKIW